MSEYLPGNLQERLRELREKNGYSTRQELAEVLGIDKSTYGRIESGVTKTITSDLLVQLSNLYNVSTDYILGLSDVPQKTYFDLKELGLSVEAAENLIVKKANQNVVNELLINEKFLYVTRQLESYFTDVVSLSIRTCNCMYDFSHDLVTELINANKLPKDKDVKDLMRQLKESKVPAERFQLDKIEYQMQAAIREIKQKVKGEVQGYIGEQFSSDMLEQVKAEVAKNGNLLEYSYEERKKFVIETVKSAMLSGSNMGNEYDEAMGVAIERMLSEVFDKWKRD